MQTIDNFNFAGKKAFVRVDFNVPSYPCCTSYPEEDSGRRW